MTHQEIQQLIDRYLDGETTPAEELQLARALRSLCGDAVASLPADWQAVLLMLGELAEGEAAYDRIVAARRPKARVLSLKWPWAAASLAVAATLLLLFVFSHRAVENTEPQQPLIAEVTTPPARQELAEEKPQTQQVSVKDKPQPQRVSARRTSAPRAVRRAADVALPDTLGDGIWQQKENVELASQICNDPLDAVEVMKDVGLLDRLNNFPSQLSGGEQQRVSIARALAKNPKLLLCDEPTGALDYITGKQILSLLHRMSRERRMTVIVITHNLAITPMADKVIQIRNGRAAGIRVNPEPVPVEEIEW